MVGSSTGYSEAEVKGFWMDVLVLLYTRREQNTSLGHAVTEIDAAVRARDIWEQSIMAMVLRSDPLS